MCRRRGSCWQAIQTATEGEIPPNFSKVWEAIEEKTVEETKKLNKELHGKYTRLEKDINVFQTMNIKSTPRKFIRLHVFYLYA